MQASNKRIADGAADLETLTPSLAWDGGEPSGASFRPIKHAPGWKVFRQNFFVAADTVLCVPYEYDAAVLGVRLLGRAVVTVNDKQVITMVRPQPPHIAARGLVWLTSTCGRA